MIIRISTIEAAIPILQGLYGTILSLVDIDDTLIVPQRPLMRLINKKERETFLNTLRSQGDETLLEKVFAEPDRMVEEAMHLFISVALEKGDILGLTARRTGYKVSSEIVTAQEHCSHKLQNLNIILSHPNSTVLFAEPTEHRNSYFIDKTLTSFYEAHSPMLYKGIIFTTNIKKSFVLQQVLAQFYKHITIIVSVDNHYENLYDEEAMCKDMGIEFIGFEYTAYRALDNTIRETIPEVMESLMNNTDGNKSAS